MMIGVSDMGKVGVLVCALNAGVALANPHSVVNDAVAVSYSELDLSKPAGVEVLYDRLQRAAAKVCGFHERTSSLFYTSTTAEKKACYQDALSRAVAQVDAPLLQAQHAG